MNRAFALVLSVLWLAACGAGDDDQAVAPAAQPAPAMAVGTSPAASIGRDTYEAVCATCHETGRDGAPATGDPADWSGRSPLWQAVLSEHAQAGYLEMPARGGNDALSDAAVAAAVDYMLSRTYPDRLPD